MEEPLLYYSYKLLNLIQTKCSKKVVKKCPEFAGDVDLYLSTIGGEA